MAGEILYNGGTTDLQVVVNGENGPERALKVYAYGSGAHTYSDTVYGVSPLALPNAKANSLSSVKLFGGTEQSNLPVVPSTYTQLKYIQGIGIQFLNLGRSATVNTRMRLKINPQYTSESAILGQAWALNGYFLMFYNNNIRWHCASAVDAPVAANNDYEIEISNGGLVVNGTSYTCTPSSSLESGNINVFRVPYQYGTVGQFKLYYLEWYEGDTLTMKLIPAKRNSDSAVGVYDTVGGTFYYYTGESFIAGDSITYPLDIVCNNGVVKYGAISKNLFNKNNRERIYGYFPGTDYNWTYNSSAYSNRIPCLPNTTYTARYNGNSTQAVLSFASTSSDSVPTADSQTVSVTNSIRQNSPTINTPITITTGASDKWLIVAYNVAEPQNTDMADNLQVEKGPSATPYVPYQDCIYADGTVEKIWLHSKNWIDVSKSTVGYFVDRVNNIIADPNWTLSDYTPVTPGTVYYFQPNSTGHQDPVICFYNASKTFIGWAPSGPGVITTPAGCYFARFSYGTGSENVQLEIGSSPTSYEPYYDGGTAVAERLLKVGDYADIQEVLTGNITRNVGIKLLDGTENWMEQGGQYVYADDATDRLASDVGGYCNYFQVKNFGLSESSVCIMWAPNNIRVVSSEATVSDFKTWLASHPVIMVYAKNLPVTEQVTAQNLNVREGDNILSITQASMSGLELEATYRRNK